MPAKGKAGIKGHDPCGTELLSRIRAAPEDRETALNRFSHSRPRLVIDTNIFVAHFFGKKSRQVVDLWRERKVVLLVSRAILNEYYEILSRFRFHKALKPLLALFDDRFNMELVQVCSRRRVVPDDPEDDKFIHCAEAGGADAIVSGDEHLLRLKAFYDEIPIRSASGFLKEVWPRLQSDE